jgi:fructokinase
LDPKSPTYGFITSTPKPGWRGTNLVGAVRHAFGDIAIGFDTDVNGAALGEFTHGCAVGLDDFVYVTVGTGIGAGGMVRGRLLHGLVHPEMGHLLLPRVVGDDFGGVCPFHASCWEGLCSGPALARRAGVAAEHLPADHPAWTITAQYMAYAIANIVLVLSPRRVILGGSVRKGGHLGEAKFFELVRERVLDALRGYVAAPLLTSEGMAQYLVPPQLGDDAGLLGAVALAEYALEG